MSGQRLIHPEDQTGEGPPVPDTPLGGAPAGDRDDQPADRTLETTKMSDIVPEKIRWLWPGRIALGRVTLLAGDPGLGKSLVTLAVAAAVSRGMAWPLGGARAPVGDVLLLSGEDDPADTVRPRLDAAGANVSRITLIGAVKGTDDKGRSTSTPFTLADGLDAIAKKLRELPECRLMVIDPLSVYYGETDSHKNNETRALLAPLGDLARETDIAILAVEHLNKSAGRAALHRVQGSIGLVGAVRAAWLVAKDQASPQRRLVLPMKNNLARDNSGLAYTIAAAENGAPVVLWESAPVTTTADAALADEQDDRQTALTDAAEWLRDQLAEGAVAVKVLRQEAKDAGLAWRTIERAKPGLGVRAFKMNFNAGWQWALQDRQESQDPHLTKLGGLGALRARTGEVFQNTHTKERENPKTAKTAKTANNMKGRGPDGGLGGLHDGDDIEEEVL